MKKIVLSFFLVSIIAACVKKGADIEYHYYNDGDYEKISKVLNVSEYPDDYLLTFPNYYTRGINRGFDNGIATLGRVLFYDKNLSADRYVSCASCHQQHLAFSDDKALSTGIQNRSTARNSLALGSTFNFSEYYGNPTFGGIPFFWDNRAFTVSDQSEQTLGNPLEMGMEMHEVVERVQALEYYNPFFDVEFNGRIDSYTILQSISEFVNALASFNSKFDQNLDEHFAKYNSTNNLQNYNFDGFTEAENNGMRLYMNNCASCHSQTFGAPSKIAANNGLAIDYIDKGVGDLTFNPYEDGLFKVPTLRNIMYTAPYMHDGSLSSIEDVLDHYSNGIANHKNLSDELKNGDKPIQFNFSATEKANLIAFFNTLSEPGLLEDEKFSDPFK